jgi:hypothetical protein
VNPKSQEIRAPHTAFLQNRILPQRKSDWNIRVFRVLHWRLIIDRMARLLRDLELHGTACLPLADRSSIERAAMRCDVGDHQAYEIASAQLAVDRQIEEGQVPNSPVDMQAGPNSPNMPWLERWLRTNQLGFIPGTPMITVGLEISVALH